VTEGSDVLAAGNLALGFLARSCMQLQQVPHSLAHITTPRGSDSAVHAVPKQALHTPAFGIQAGR
jgi:hypothetical protein